MNRDDCTVLVCSCDKYADLLPPFVTLFGRFWPDCPFKRVLVTETAPASVAGFDRVIACGAGGNWCSRLVTALDRIATPYVLMLCDDYYLAEPVDTARLLDRLETMRAADADNLRLIPNPKPAANNAQPFGASGDLFRYKPGTAYSIATQAGFWRRDFLRTLANGKSSIWEFERYGSFDPAVGAKPLLVTRTKEFPFIDAVHKGCWEKFGLALLAREGVAYDGARGLPPFKTRLIETCKALVFAVFPADWIVRVQNRLAVGARERSAWNRG